MGEVVDLDVCALWLGRYVLACTSVLCGSSGSRDCCPLPHIHVPDSEEATLLAAWIICMSALSALQNKCSKGQLQYVSHSS